MRAKVHRIMSVLLILLIICVSASPSQAIEPRASDYFAVTQAWATALGGGKVIVEFDMGTTHTMKQLGAKEIVLKEKQSDGGYDTVKTYTSSNTAGLIKTNSTCAYGSVTYSGTSGKKYYAIVKFYAKNSDGSETLYQATNTITA